MSFYISFLFIKGEFLLYKVRTKLISKLHSMMTHILMSWFKESTERQKTRFVKETVENVDLHKAVLNKTMTTQEYCVKYDFVASLMLVAGLIWHQKKLKMIKITPLFGGDFDHPTHHTNIALYCIKFSPYNQQGSLIT